MSPYILNMNIFKDLEGLQTCFFLFIFQTFTVFMAVINYKICVFYIESKVLEF